MSSSCTMQKHSFSKHSFFMLSFYGKCYSSHPKNIKEKKSTNRRYLGVSTTGHRQNALLRCCFSPTIKTQVQKRSNLLVQWRALTYVYGTLHRKKKKILGMGTLHRKIASNDILRRQIDFTDFTDFCGTPIWVVAAVSLHMYILVNL